MNNILKIIPIISVLVLLTGCSFFNNNIDTEVEGTTEDTADVLQIETIKDICELVTLKCEYHNVAKSVKEKGSGLAHLGEVDRTFWIEYVGEAEISFQANDIIINQDGTDVSIMLPKPTVSCRVLQDSWNEDSYVFSSDHMLIQKNKITAEDQTDAIGDAEKQMKESIENNSSLMSTARNQAKDIIENYINQMGELTGKTYNVIWKDDGFIESNEN